MTGLGWAAAAAVALALALGAAALGRALPASRALDLLGSFLLLLPAGWLASVGLLVVTAGPAALVDIVAGVVTEALVHSSVAGAVAGQVGALGWLWGRRAAVAWVRPPAWGWAAGVAVGTANLALAAAVSALAERLGGDPPSQVFAEVLATGAGPGAWLARASLAVVPPLAEELVFRGQLHGLVARARGERAAILLGGAVFGALHLADPSVVPQLVLFGLALGWLRARTGSVGPAIVAHLVNNAVAVLP